MSKPKTVAISCPNCSKQAVLSELIKSVPNFGKLLISTLYCKRCGFKFNDVMNAEFHKPKAFRLKVEKPIDLRTRLVKSSSGTVKISKLNIEIEPGIASEGYITNIEGLLERVEAALKVLQASSENKKSVEKKLELVRKAKGAEFPFEIKVLDPFGNSALIGKKVKELKLNEKEIKKLKKNIQVFEIKK